jgi:putative aminopeptidase FrvX
MINGRKASAKKDPKAVFLRVKTVEKNGRVSFQPIGRREWTASGEKISIALAS